MTEQTTKADPTPGEWHFTSAAEMHDCYEDEDGRTPKAGVWSQTDDDDVLILVARRDDDARLTAAAPDLLAACQDALIATAEEGRHAECQYCLAPLKGEERYTIHERYCWVPKVRAAVAKARQ